MSALRKARSATSSGAALRLSRREMLAGGIGAGALIALPDLSLAGRAAGRSARSAGPGGPGSRHVLLYGTPQAEPFPGGSAAKVTLTVVDAATAVVSKQGSLTITGIADGTSILPTPVFAPGTAII